MMLSVAKRDTLLLARENGILMSLQATPSAIRIMIVEDDTLTRKTLSLAIDAEPTFDLVAEFDSVAPALAWLAAHPIDLLLTDLSLPDGSGIDIIRACVLQHPQCDILVLSMSSDEDTILASIEAGATGYLLKGAGRVDVVRALLELRAGGSPISPLIARKLLQRMRTEKMPHPNPVVELPAAEARDGATLTKREAAILELIARGDTYLHVANVLSLSVGTVQTHIKNIYEKLSVHSRGEAVYQAHRRGLLKMDSSEPKR